MFTGIEVWLDTENFKACMKKLYRSKKWVTSPGFMPFSTYDTVVGRSSSKLRQPMTTDEWFNLNHVVPLPASIQRPLANSQQLHQLGVRHGVKAPTSDWLIVENQAFGAARQRWELWHLGLTVLMPPGWHSQSLDWNSNQLKRKKERKKNLGISTRLSRLVLNWGGASSCGCIRERTSLPQGNGGKKSLSDSKARMSDSRCR